MRSTLLISILGALTACGEGSHAGTACLELKTEQSMCPAASSLRVGDLFVYTPTHCGEEVRALNGEGERKSVTLGANPIEACCYSAEISDGDDQCVVGRPYFEGTEQLMAPLRPETAIASERAAAWAAAGAGEHASVAAFARLSLQLMALGAPTPLLRDVHQAAFEEVKHAEQCWRLAERFGGTRVAAGPFPFGEAAARPVTLAELAENAMREGCLAETLGAHVLTVAAELSPEAEVQRALTEMAEEESRHAVLSFRIVAWALQSGDADVRASVQRALTEPWPRLDIAELSVRTGVDRQVLAAAAMTGVREVLTPAVARLMA